MLLSATVMRSAGAVEEVDITREDGLLKIIEWWRFAGAPLSRFSPLPCAASLYVVFSARPETI
jgi:hypothetical protein